MSTTPPCTSNPDDFYNPDTMATAAVACFDCPLFDECHELGRGEEYGVWAGEIKPLSLAEMAPVELHAATAEAMFRQGLAVADIAAALDLSVRHIQKLTKNARVEMHGPQRDPEERDAAIREAVEAGFSIREVAELTGTSTATVQRVRKDVLAERAIESEAHTSVRGDSVCAA